MSRPTLTGLVSGNLVEFSWYVDIESTEHRNVLRKLIALNKLFRGKAAGFRLAYVDASKRKIYQVLDCKYNIELTEANLFEAKQKYGVNSFGITKEGHLVLVFSYSGSLGV